MKSHKTLGCLLLCAAALPLSAQTGETSHPARRTLPAERREVVGYFPQWGIYNRRYVPVDMVRSGAVRWLTQVDYAQASIQNNACVLGDPKADTDTAFAAADSIDGMADDPTAPLRGNLHQLQLLRRRYPKLRILISIEGKPELFAQAARPEHRVAFVHSCIARFLQGHLAPGVEAPHLFDGIDVDWEYPDASQAADFYGLMEEFRRQMDGFRWQATALRAGSSQRGYTLSIASAAAKKHITPFDWKRIAKSVDQIGVMAYDYNGPWSRDTGLHAPLASTNPNEETVSTTMDTYLQSGAPAGQLLLGIPFYAYQWKNVAAGGSYGLNSHGDAVRGNLNQSTAVTLMQNPTAKLHRDPTSHAPWIYDGSNFLTFEDAVSLRAKLDLVKRLNLGGVMIWELSGDTNDAQLLHALAADKTASSTK